MATRKAPARKAVTQRAVVAVPEAVGPTIIGELGTEHEDLDLAFGYFGQTIRVNPDASDLEFMEFMEKAANIDELDEAEAMKATLGYIRQQVHPDDWDLFWSTAKKNRQNTLDLLTTSKAILEAVAGFPTGQSSDSSAGRRSTGRKSPVGSSSRARTSKSVVERALSAVPGRPDLQSVVLLSAEAREAEAARRAG